MSRGLPCMLNWRGFCGQVDAGPTSVTDDADRREKVEDQISPHVCALLFLSAVPRTAVLRETQCTLFPTPAVTEALRWLHRAGAHADTDPHHMSFAGARLEHEASPAPGSPLAPGHSAVLRACLHASERADVGRCQSAAHAMRCPACPKRPAQMKKSGTDMISMWMFGTDLSCWNPRPSSHVAVRADFLSHIKWQQGPRVSQTVPACVVSSCCRGGAMRRKGHGMPEARQGVCRSSQLAAVSRGNGACCAQGAAA
eukprot:1893643-Rhodomonas_salina.2